MCASLGPVLSPLHFESYLLLQSVHYGQVGAAFGAVRPGLVPAPALNLTRDGKVVTGVIQQIPPWGAAPTATHCKGKNRLVLCS